MHDRHQYSPKSNTLKYHFAHAIQKFALVSEQYVIICAHIQYLPNFWDIIITFEQTNKPFENGGETLQTPQTTYL